MSAADLVRITALVAGVKSFALRGGFLAVMLVACFIVAYVAGSQSGRDKERARNAADIRKVLAESSKAIEARMIVRAPMVQQAIQSAVKAKARHDTAATVFDARVQQHTDSTVSIDAGPPVTSIPVTIAMPEIQTCRSALTASDSALTILQAQFQDVQKDRDTWKKRADDDEAAQPKPARFGFKSGVTIGVGLVLLLVHLVK